MRYPLTLLLLLSACGGSTPANSTVQFVMKMTVPSGGELLQCQFVKVHSGESYMVAADHHYTPGSHHMLLYRTDVTTLQPGMDQLQDCYEGSGGTIMSHVRGVLLRSQEPDGSMTLPDGVGYKLASEEVLLLQVHYLNASAGALQSTVTVNLHTISDASKIQNLAGVLFYYDPFIDVPAGQMATASARCTLTQDITLLGVFPHYHARGIGYQAYLDIGGSPAPSPFYTSTDWSHPAPWTGGPLDISAGTSIRWYCDYDNSQGAAEYFQGQSALSNEMCMFTGGDYPAMDPDSEECIKDMDLFGTGTQTCGQTLDCFQACPPGSAPTTIGIAAMADVSDCWQKCIVDSCPAASAPLLTQLACMAASCQSQCAVSASDCQSCAQTNCLSQSVACLSAACD